MGDRPGDGLAISTQKTKDFRALQLCTAKSPLTAAGWLPARGTHLPLAAAGVVSVLLGLGEGGVVLLGLAGGQLGLIGVLGGLVGLGVGVGPGILVSLQQQPAQVNKSFLLLVSRRLSCMHPANTQEYTRQLPGEG